MGTPGMERTITAAAARPAPAAAAAPPVARRLRDPLLRTYRRTDTAAVVLAVGAGWAAAQAGAGSLAAVARQPVSLADALLLGGLVWAWPLVGDAVGLYRADLVPGTRTEAARVARAVGIATLVPLLAALVAAGDSVRPADVPLFFAAATGLVLGTRALVRLPAQRRRRRAPARVVIAGSGPRALALWREVRDRPELGLRVLGFLDDDGDVFARATGLPHLGAAHDEAEVERTLAALDVDDVLITLPARSRYAEIQGVIAACERTGTDARFFADVFEVATARARLEDGTAVALRAFPGGAARRVKRAMDVAVAGAALALLAPLMALIAAAVRLDSPGPVLFSQERYGLHRHRFRVWKFRTMAADAEARQTALEARNEADGALFKIRDDPRVTRVGRWLRRTSLDELPQLVNVLRGEMSLVGPRPLPVRDVARFSAPWLMRRFAAPPGLTGLWQVHGRSAAGWDDFVAMDLHYIDRWSLGLDLRILAATVPAVLRGHGAM